MKKPVLYVQTLPNNKRKLAFDFCYSAMLGADQLNIKVKHFQNVFDLSNDATNIVVGSVEMCANWLEATGRSVPKSIDISPFHEFLGRNVYIVDIQDIKYPAFIKPYSQIKAFTGFVAENKLYVDVFSENYEGLVLAQDIIEIVSEYRMYVNCHKIVGMKHYSGDCLIFPNSKVIKECFERSKEILDFHSYALDFGVLDDGRTILIEANDGWAIGNYGLDPHDYYLFVRNRWLQITGIRHRME